MASEIKVDKTNINVFNFEDILHKLNLSLSALASSKNKERKIHIDLSEVNFLDPHSITNFCMILRYLRNYSINTSLSLPADNNAGKYLKRMNFFNTIPRETKLFDKSNLDLCKKSPAPAESDVLLELTPIQKQKDINKIIDYTIKKISHILEANLGYGENDLSAFCTALAETCQNIKDHSENKGLVAVQKYHSKTNYVIMSICDLGIGIKKSLSYRYNVLSFPHAKSIQHALKLGTSRLKDRGKGLYRVLEIVKKYNGTFIMRSGSGRVTVGKQNVSFNVPHFPGTQIFIRLNEKN